MEFAPRFEFEGDHRPERDLEFGRLRRAVEAVLSPTGPGRGKDRYTQLELLLDIEPQVGADGRLRYMVTSGLAVELTTGYERPHHDLDIVIMDPQNRRRWEVYGTDNVTPQAYWANMEFDPGFLQDTARFVPARRDRPTRFKTAVVHPGIILVQKSSNAFGREPRPKDKDDVVAIVRFWKEREGYAHAWNPVIRKALDALPAREFETTLARVRAVLK